MAKDPVRAMNNLKRLSKPMLVMVHTVGDAVAVNLALAMFAKSAAQHDEPGIAERLAAINNAFVDGQPDDWNCDDPDCTACNGEIEEPRARAYEPNVVEFVLNGSARRDN